MDFDSLIYALQALPDGALLRLNDAGDLPAAGRDHTYQLTRGRQKKTGRAHRTRTSQGSCPDCALRGVCYASVGPISWHWQDLSGDEWTAPAATSLDWRKVLTLARACTRLRAWTYTHWPWRRYAGTLRHALRLGLVINISVEDPLEALHAYRAGFPVALVGPPDLRSPIDLAPDVRGIPCPALMGSGMTCDNCGGGRPLCQRAARCFVIVFPAHGHRARKVWERIKHYWQGGN